MNGNDKITWKGKVYDLRDSNEMKEFVQMVYRDVLLFPRNFPSTMKLIRIFVGATILTILTSFFVSLFLNNWIWFARFGSICVIIGVLFIFYDISEYYDKKLRAIQRSHLFLNMIFTNFFERILSNYNLPAKERNEIEKIEAEILKQFNEKKCENDELELDTRQEEQLHKEMLRKCEASILIVGTLIWGFGDLIGIFFKH